MPKVAIFPVFTIKEGFLEDFVARVMRQRDDCLREEPGCLHFDVLRPAEGARTVCLYEIYADEAALERHRTYAHYASFKSETDPWVEALAISKFALVE